MILFLKRVPEIKENTYEGKNIKYHVGNPDVAGEVISSADCNGYVEVIFTKPVGFSGNTSRGLNKFWKCSSKLLFNTPEEAWANKRY